MDNHTRCTVCYIVVLNNSFSNQVSDPTGFNEILQVAIQMKKIAWNRVFCKPIRQITIDRVLHWLSTIYDTWCVLYTITVWTFYISEDKQHYEAHSSEDCIDEDHSCCCWSRTCCYWITCTLSWCSNPSSSRGSAIARTCKGKFI